MQTVIHNNSASTKLNKWSKKNCDERPHHRGIFYGGKFNVAMDKRIGAVAYVHAVETVCSIAF